MENIWIGITTSLEPINLLFNVFGVIVGIIVGAIPGMSGPMAIALFIPATFAMDPIPAVIFFTAIYCGSTFGGSVSAILLNIPGTSAAAATCLDGNQLAKQGMAGKALGTAALTSAIGGVFSCVVLLLCAPLLADFALAFGPTEYFVLAAMGISAISSLGAQSQLKSLLSACIGLFLATIGMDALTGQARFTFGQMFLLDGIGFIPALIGLFAITEVFASFNITGPVEILDSKVKTVLPTVAELLKIKWTVFKSMIIGTWVGILPGEGATVAAFLSYAEAMRSSKTPEKFGTGILEGIAAPEAANNAAVGGSYVPTMALGIPGSATAAVLLGALTLHGITAGPLLFINQTKFAYGVIMAMFISNALFLILGIFTTRYFAKVLDIRFSILGPAIIMFAVLGTYTLRNNVFDIWLMLFFGLLGLVMREVKLPVAPFILGLVLGPMLEINLRRGILVHDGLINALLCSPVAIVLEVITVGMALMPIYKGIKARVRNQEI